MFFKQNNVDMCEIMEKRFVLKDGMPKNTEESNSRICEQIFAFMETEKRFLIPAYSLWELSKELGISSKRISIAINNILGQNFLEFLNRFRVKEAKNILSGVSETGNFERLDEIYARCGFGSRSSYYLCFKKYVGVTPQQYIEKCRENVNL